MERGTVLILILSAPCSYYSLIINLGSPSTEQIPVQNKLISLTHTPNQINMHTHKWTFVYTFIIKHTNTNNSMVTLSVSKIFKHWLWFINCLILDSCWFFNLVEIASIDVSNTLVTCRLISYCWIIFWSLILKMYIFKINDLSLIYL